MFTSFCIEFSSAEKKIVKIVFELKTLNLGILEVVKGSNLKGWF